MKPLVPLGPRDRGEAVANLQDALLLLIQGRNIFVSADEQYCQKCRREINWLDFVSSALQPPTTEITLK